MIKKQQGVIDSRTYKLVELNYKRGCPICGPHTGCNGTTKKEDRSWKKFRKNQYKPLK
jgi:hypothetical protein